MNVSHDSPQMQLKAVIYATDFSPCSDNAGMYATLLASQFNAELVAAHSFVLTNAAMEAEATAASLSKSQQRKDLQTALDAATARFSKGVKRAIPVLLEGDPREQIPRLAAKYTPSMVVLGTQGRGRMERGIIGSVAERIMRATEGPALTVGPAVPACEPACLPFQRILYATGLSTAAARGATYAVAMAQAFHASLEVLHVANPDYINDPERLGEVRKEFYAVLEELVPQQADMLNKPRGTIEVGTAHVRILEHLHELKPDLLVLSIRKSNHLWLQSRLSGAFNIIANAPCPVMTITG